LKRCGPIWPRSELAGVTAEFSSVRADVTAEIAGIKTELAGLRAIVNAKPDTLTIYQAVLAMMAAMFAMVVGTAVLVKTVGTIP
jgi:hypothetical protein